jgi:uncharacterized protein YbjT (DUF2867 family)
VQSFTHLFLDVPMQILMTGATGLVGQGVLQEILASPAVTRIGLLSRHSIELADPRIDLLKVEQFDALDSVRDRLGAWDACLYCAGAPPLGTPQAEYRHVTLDLTLLVARAYAERNPDGRFLYISGAHADAASRFMPLRVKGETENALQALPIRTVMLRPGGIQPVHGQRSPHAWMRPLYILGSPLMRLGVQVLPGIMTTTAAVGRCLLALVEMPNPPAIIENGDINRFLA